jgi:hypothetical protein
LLIPTAYLRLLAKHEDLEKEKNRKGGSRGKRDKRRQC